MPRRSPTASEPAAISPARGPAINGTGLAHCRERASVKIAMEAFPAQSIIALVACGVGLGFIASRTSASRATAWSTGRSPPPGPRLDVGVAYHTDGIAPASQAFLAAGRRAGRAMR